MMMGKDGVMNIQKLIYLKLAFILETFQDIQECLEKRKDSIASSVSAASSSSSMRVATKASEIAQLALEET